MQFVRLCLATAIVLGCGGGASPPAQHPAQSSPTLVTLSIIATNDLHGHLSRLPLLAGYLHNVRAQRNAVVLVDAGDMFQGTIESNLNEGAAVVAAYNEMGYHGVTIGNHEFDFGPLGPSPVPENKTDDPRGALRSRAREASFPFLSASISDKDGDLFRGDNIVPTSITDAAGIKVGLIGITTEDTPFTTIAANFEGLAMLPLDKVVATRAKELRNQGAAIVVVVAHAGGACAAFDDSHHLEVCKPDAEIFALARTLPEGLVDVIAAGHTHAGVAHEVNGIAIVEAFARGTAFSRVDIVVDKATGEMLERKIFAPQALCPSEQAFPCVANYEGAPVVADPKVAATIAPAIENAKAIRERKLGVTITSDIKRSYGRESALGNLFVDLMKAHVPEADVAITNGGGLRADLPVGELTYGQLYEASPFDNRLTTIELTGKELASILAANLGGDGGILSIAGIRVIATCEGGSLQVNVRRDTGPIVQPDESLTVLTNDFIATGGDGIVASLHLAPTRVHIGTTVMRDAMAESLQKRGGTLSGTDAQLFNPMRPRIRYDGTRPLGCE